jgi:hypothetical protein
MPIPFKVHELLKEHGDDLAELEAFARPQGRTAQECHEWLEARGYALSYSAVSGWKAKFTADCLRERFGRSSELAAALRGAVGQDFSAVADAAKMQLTNVVLEQVAQLEQDGKIDPLDIQRMTRSLANLVGTEERQRKMLAAQFDREVASRQKDGPNKRALTDEDLAAVRKAVFG